MSYAQRRELGGNRVVSTAMTVVVFTALMYAIVTGLAYDVIKKSASDLKLFDVTEKPPPPQKPPPPPKDMPKVPPPPISPPPLVRMEAPPPPIQTVTAPPPPVYIPPVVAAPPPPPLPPHKTQSAQSAVGSLTGLFTTDDYPASAQAANAEGTAQAQLTIGPDGRVTSCNLIRSTGNSSLDSTTCNILRRRAKFVPARDSNGNATSDTITTPPIIWRLEG